VLITGVGGFAARHLVGLSVRAGVELVGLGRGEAAPPEVAPRLGAYLKADLTDVERTRVAVRRASPDRVFHLAAEASVASSWRHPRETIWRNVVGTQNVLDAVRFEAPHARVMVACSGEGYGPVAKARLPVTECEPLRPQNPYAASKAAVDILSGYYADGYGLDVVRSRAFNHAGPGQADTYVVSNFARQVAAAEASRGGHVTIETGDTSVRRDFTDVRDVVRAYWVMLELGVSGDIFNVCSGRSTPVSKILDLLATHTDLHVEQHRDESRGRPRETEEIVGCSERLRQATGWRPEIELGETISATLDWWRNHLRETARL
jgi:GDP-4-dehydro-6-deoxy-D-mannose reductase